jgi:predicted GH43/DUF377 family glycosyl hydrolase
MGNSGLLLEIDEGWLVLTHGVGALRTYCIGACLLYKDDPSKVLARITVPLIRPSEKQRFGYVPNVVYSCGALVNGRMLLLPYVIADNATTFATVGLDALIACPTNGRQPDPDWWRRLQRRARRRTIMPG